MHSRDAKLTASGSLFSSNPITAQKCRFLLLLLLRKHMLFFFFLLLLPYLWTKGRMSLYGFLGKWCTSFWLLLSERGWRKIFIPQVKIIGVYLCHWLLLLRDLSWWRLLSNISTGYSFSQHKPKRLILIIPVGETMLCNRTGGTIYSEVEYWQNNASGTDSQYQKLNYE